MLISSTLLAVRAQALERQGTALRLLTPWQIPPRDVYEDAIYGVPMTSGGWVRDRLKQGTKTEGVNGDQAQANY